MILNLTPTREPALSDAEPESEQDSPFAPLFTAGTVPHALATLDEFGRPLAGVYVPDPLLL